MTSILTRASDVLQRVQVGGRRVADSIVQAPGEAVEFVRKNPVTSAVGVSGGVLAGVTAVQIVRKARKKSVARKKTHARRARPKRKSPLRRAKKPRSRVRKGQRRPYTAGKRKDTSTRRIRFTKNNQPYVILASGKARFIKKSSVSRMRKRKGGKY